MDIRTLHMTEHNPDCPVCGTHPEITSLAVRQADYRIDTVQ